MPKTAAQPAVIRHGDIVVTSISKTSSKGLKPIKGNALATGTATGHSHRFTPSTAGKLYACTDGTTLLHLTGPAKLVHEEHETVKLAAGDYRVSHKRQYDREHGWQNVAD